MLFSIYIKNRLIYIYIYIYIYEPVSLKTGLNDIEMKIQITALRESNNFF